MDTGLFEEHESAMLRRLFLLVVLLLAAPVAYGQSRSDQAYCEELVYLYERYVGSSTFGPRKPVPQPDVEARWAMSRCDARDPAPAIPILERKLTNARMTLPPR